MDNTYSYTDLKWEIKEIKIKEDDAKFVNQAQKDYETSRKHINNSEFHIWRAALKSYHLSTYDRKVQLWDQQWKQNVTIWLIRSFVDILVASLHEKPLVFKATAINKQWADNKENILKTLDYISDVSWFHKQLKDTMADWLVIGEICMRIWYKNTSKTEKYTSIVDGSIITEDVEVEEKNYPYASNIPVFNVFPDPYTWPLRYITERWVVSYAEFIEVFWNTIKSKKNRSPFKDKDLLALVSINRNGADLQDYWNIVHQIHEKVNQEFWEKDAFERPTSNGSNFPTWTPVDQDPDVIEGLIEFKSTWYNWRLVIIANNYPVYIWPNPFWFIPYVVKAANQTRARFWEGIPYMLKGLEEVWNSFISNYFDSARSIANPTIVVQKNLMLNDEELEDWTPWWILYTEDNANWNVAYRLDKWRLDDFWILPLLQQLASQITWISEYDQWISAKERTATWALAVSQSSQKRMSPYVSNFLDAISIVAQMWLKLVKKYWTAKQMIYILDDEWNQTWEAIQKSNLLWGVNLSLETEWMFWTNQALEAKKLIDLYNTLWPSGFFKSDEMWKEIMKKSGYNASKFITEPWQWNLPANHEQIAATTAQTWIPWVNAPVTTDATDLWNEAWQWVTPNVDLGNKWQGQNN